MSAIASYRELLRIVGPAYIVVAFLGRIPLAMSQLGALVMVSAHTDRYALGGAAAGALAVANALGAPFFGALADRIGQRLVVMIQSIVGGIGLVGVVVVTQENYSGAIIIAVSAVTGLAIPQVGPLARVRWGAILHGRNEQWRGEQSRLVDAAFSYEGAADEASFVLGPATVGLLAVVADPAGALLAAAVMLIAFGTGFAIHPTAELTANHRISSGGSGRFFTAAFGILLFAQSFVGMVFGSVQTGSAVLATDAGRPGLAGVIHAMLGVGSVMAALAVAGLPERIGYEKRSLASAAGLLILSTPLLLVNSIVALVLVVLFLGLAVAPYMISNFALAGHLVPTERVGTAMTMLAGATGLGYAVGSSIAGWLADDGGHTPAFAVTVTASGLAFLLAASAQRVLTSSRA